MDLEKNSQDSSHARWLLFFAPNLPVLTIGLGGWLCETLLLGVCRDSVYQMRGLMPMLAVLTLAWFWLTCAWILWGGSQIVRARLAAGTVLARVSCYAIWAVAAAGVVLYVASWGFYLRAGRFVGL